MHSPEAGVKEFVVWRKSSRRRHRLDGFLTGPEFEALHIRQCVECQGVLVIQLCPPFQGSYSRRIRAPTRKRYAEIVVRRRIIGILCQDLLIYLLRFDVPTRTKINIAESTSSVIVCRIECQRSFEGGDRMG